MKRAAQISALAVLLGAVAIWAAAGAHGGWTKTSVPVKTLDEVTGIEAISYERRFVPGLDFLGAAAGLSLLGAAASLFFRKPLRP